MDITLSMHMHTLQYVRFCMYARLCIAILYIVPDLHYILSMTSNSCIFYSFDPYTII